VISGLISRRQAFRIFAGAALVGTRRWSIGAQAVEPATVYFFSPETNINNFGTLKGEFDAFLAPAGGHRFQPFSDRAKFETVLHQKRPGLYIMSSWHYTQLQEREEWTPVLIGTLKNKTTQRHVLCARRSGADLASLAGVTIASAGKRDFTQGLLSQILPPAQLHLLTTLKVLEVPKDIDALMAVTLGGAAAAVSSEVGLERLRNTNPKQFEQLNALATGTDRLLPIIVSPGPLDPACTNLLNILSAMGADPEGSQRLRMLGLDGWKPIEPAQLQQLRT
jgi:hypothetical protein